MTGPRAPDSRDAAAAARAIARSGLFDARYYAGLSGRPDEDAEALLEHYLAHGEALGAKPNPFFDPRWYAFKYLNPPSPSGALRHYLEQGERAGARPCCLFEPQWYAKAYAVEEGRSALAHYLAHRSRNEVDPNRFFDVAFYLKANPDVVGAGIDGFEHWLKWGQYEGRAGSANFSSAYVWQRYLGNDRRRDPFTAFMDVGLEFGWEATPGGSGVTVHRLIKSYSAPGPLFEPLGPEVELAVDAPKVVALYLPQYHAIPENDAWWGDGFTEWRNLPRGAPRFEGHVQPRIPRDLGFYTLEGTTTLRRQVDLARRAGVHGFCFHYYNFNGQRLLERPVEAFLAERDIDFPFCLMWANENWTRRWDGSEREVLIRQDYRREDLPDLVADVARHMKDPRYMRTAEGRPLLFLYRADIIPDCARTLEAWRSEFRRAHALDPLILMSQSFDVVDPRPYGFDGAVEFPPHKLGAKLPSLNGSLTVLDPDYAGTARDYAAIVAQSLAVGATPFPLVKTAFPSWDNDARRQGQGMTFVNSTPAAGCEPKWCN